LSTVDYHCHILPLIDDGAGSLDEALEMAQMAVRTGYETVIATPHYETYFYENTRAGILQAVQALQKEVDRARIDLKIEPGSEIMLGPEIPSLLAQKKLMTQQDRGTHVLVELPFRICPLWADDVLYKIRLLGITPILAHPERYLWLEDDLRWLKTHRESGLLLQANVSSLRGKYGRSIQARIEQLDSHGLIALWGSDAHSVRGYQILHSEGR